MSNKNKTKSKTAAPKVVEEQNLTSEVNETKTSADSTEEVKTTEENNEGTVEVESQNKSAEENMTTEEPTSDETDNPSSNENNETEIKEEKSSETVMATAPYTTEYVEGVGLVKGRPIEDYALGNDVKAEEITDENRQKLEEIAKIAAEESAKYTYDFSEKSQLEEVVIAENVATTVLDVFVTGSEEESENEGEVKPSHVVATDGLTENPEEADVVDNDDNVDPLPEIKGKYYINVGENLPFNRQEKVENILSKLKYKWIVTALGKFLVGPFENGEIAFKERKVLLGKGLKGIVTIME